MKITKFIPAIASILIIGFRYFSNWCIDNISVCYGTWVHWIALPITKPLYFFSLYFLPIAIILAFVPREIFKSWLKFAAWSLPLLFIFVATQPVVSSFMSTNRDDAARLAGQVFLAVSLAIVLWKWWKSRDSGQV